MLRKSLLVLSVFAGGALPAAAQTAPAAAIAVDASEASSALQQVQYYPPRSSRYEYVYEYEPDARIYAPPPGRVYVRPDGQRYVSGGTVYAPPGARIYSAPQPRIYSAPRGTYGSEERRYERRAQTAAAVAPMRRAVPDQFRMQTVSYETKYKAGTIVIDTSKRFLYLVQGDGTAIRYGVGVGKDGFQWKGTHKVSNKREWPDWRPPAEMLKRRPDLPTFMAGGPDNPLGARALYLGSTLYRIHGSNEPWTIGQAVSSGCFRMTNEDVTDLYERVPVGARVVVI